MKVSRERLALLGKSLPEALCTIASLINQILRFTRSLVSGNCENVELNDTCIVTKKITLKLLREDKLKAE